MRLLFCGLLLNLSIVLLPSLAQAADSVDIYTGVVTDYLFRGISQTENRPAVQAGAEYRHSIGLYAGTFISNVNTDPYQEPGDDGSRVEFDLYTGFGQEVKSLNFGWDVGLIAALYDQNKDNAYEIYTSGSFGPWGNFSTLVVKLSYDWDRKNLIGEAKGIFDVGKGFDVFLIPGYVRLDDKAAEDYAFVTLGVGTDFEIKKIIETLDISINYTTTNIDERPDDNRNLVRDSWWLALTAHF